MAELSSFSYIDGDMHTSGEDCDSGCGDVRAVVAVTQLALEGVTRINAVGFMGAAFNILMYGSPLAAMG
ncbi:hypothetical protein Ahy_B01g055666 [Arachis hypogaea]|uniref:Uncharacterized protein n=1 Tax=Arachis hypogaea TaxID=3818 RepID=A0A445AWS8_ARAHY|nr:hypothetical protein Ahy_B01g055666 [Arachis hypogaea]